MNHEKVGNLNKPIMGKDTKLVIKDLPRKKSLGWSDSFSVEFYQTVKEKLRPILPNLFKKKLNARKHFQTHFARPELHSEQSQAKTSQGEKYFMPMKTDAK